MQRFSRLCFSALLLGLFFISGCDTAVVTNGNIVGVQSGQFLYESGYLQVAYSHPIDRVWQACEQTLQELHATNIQKERKIASGKLTATIYEDKIIMKLEYAGKDRTTVAVLAGIGGNQLAARLIHEKIAKFLSSMEKEKPAELSAASSVEENGGSKSAPSDSRLNAVPDKEKEPAPLEIQPIIDETEEGNAAP